MRAAFALLAPVAALALAGCNEDAAPLVVPCLNDQGCDAALVCRAGQCVPPESKVPYPKAPYGFSQGSTIGSLSFQGFVDAQVSTSALEPINLADFYNPHAHDATYEPDGPADDDRLFPPGSPYGAGKKKPTALLIDIASVWCGPCNEEAKNLFNGLHAKYRPCGGEFLFQLAEGAAPGSPVDQHILTNWVTSYKVAYPATIDPGKQLYPLYSADSFPDGAIVDTSTMKIVEVLLGTPDQTFWSSYESLLDAKCLAGK